MKNQQTVRSARFRRILSITGVNLILIFAGCQTTVFNPRPLPGEIQIHFEGLRPVGNENTFLYYAIYDAADGFMKPERAPIRGFHRVDGATAGYIIRGLLRPGSYALVAFHDENKNGKLDLNKMGFPLEGFAFSNNPLLNQGQPDWQQTSFRLTEKKKIVPVRMIYLYGRTQSGELKPLAEEVAK